MLKLIERSFNAAYSTSFICLLLLSTNVTLLIAENYLVSSLKMFLLLLFFNFSLSMAIILYHNNLIFLKYSTLSTNYKTNEYKTSSLEFLKISGIFLLTTLVSSISTFTKWIPLNLMRVADCIFCLFCGLIIFMSSSTDFLNNSKRIIYKMLCFKRSEDVDVDFVEILVADVLTSFSKPVMMLVEPEYVIIRSIIFSLPYIIRLKQCAFEYSKTTEMNRNKVHILNFIKYLLLLSSNFLLYFLQNSKMIGFGYSLAATSIILASYWDIFVDWGLGQKRVRNAVGIIIYILCLQNIILRQASIPLFSKLFFPTAAFANGAEILRRVLWVHLRLTNHLMNQESI